MKPFTFPGVKIGIKGHLKNRKLLYGILVALLVLGILLGVLTRIPQDKKKADSTDTSSPLMILPGKNMTYPLEELDADNHAIVTISGIREEPTGYPSEEGLHYYAYRTSEPSVRRYENWTNVHNLTEYTFINISEEGDWYLFIANEGNTTLGYTLALEWVWYSDVPILPGRYLTYGILLIIYSVLFISIIAMRDRFKRVKIREGNESEKNREKSNTD